MAKIIATILPILSIFGDLASAQPNSAIRIDDFGCGMANGNGGFVFADISRVVITHSGMHKSFLSSNHWFLRWRTNTTYNQAMAIWFARVTSHHPPTGRPRNSTSRILVLFVVLLMG